MNVGQAVKMWKEPTTKQSKCLLRYIISQAVWDRSLRTVCFVWRDLNQGEGKKI